MFWGCEVTSGKQYNLQEGNILEGQAADGESKMLHISNASLNTSKKTPSGGKFKVFCQTGDKKFLIANLQEGQSENFSLDLYFKQEEEATFSVSGKGEAVVHLTGYWETSPDLMDDEYGMGPLEMDMEDDDDEADPVTREHIDEAKANALRNATLAALQGEEDDEDSEESDEEVAPAAVIKSKKTTQVVTKKPVVEEDSEDDSDDPVMPAGKAAAVAQEDSEEDSDEAPVLAQKAPQFEDSDDSSDDFDMQKILANKKRKAEQAKAGNEHKRQKVGDAKEKHGKNQNKGKHQQKHKGGNQNKGGQGKKRHHKNKGKR
jgi:hypothetical protein